MRSIHARYPFLREARDAVSEADVELPTLVTKDSSPILRRARERVDGAIRSGRVSDPERDVYVETLSYPLARVLVSLVDEPALTTRYAEAEAQRAYELFGTEIRQGSAQLRSGENELLRFETLLEEFELSEAVRETHEGYRIGVPAYLSLATELREGRWRLVNRALVDGEVPISESELLTLLREAVRQRIAEGLPLSVPTAVEMPLESDVERIRQELANDTVPNDIDTVDPASFPPCIEALIERVTTGESLPLPARFALLSFLAGIGMDLEEITDRFETWADDVNLEYQYTHIHGESRSGAYPPPSCETMQAYGDCVNMDDLCAEISHPLAYYANRIEAD